jgi:hypothetical protein
MIIRFMGLITHAHIDGTDVAVLFTADHHHARFIVPEADIVGSDDTLLTNRCFGLTGRRVSFSAAGPVERSGLVGVPSLSLLGGSNATVHGNVATRTATDPFDSFVEIAGGSYGIEDYFEEKATFNGTDFICMPQTVTFSTTDITSDVTVSGLSEVLVLKPTATVTITNLDVRIAAPPHFDTYGKFFDPPATIKVPTQVNAPSCSDGEPAFIPKCPRQPDQNMTVECADTQYP